MLSFKMDLIWVCPLVFLYLGVFSFGSSKNVSSRPAVVNIGALFTMDSTIGKVAKIAIEEAVKDVNSNFSILHGTKLVVKMQNTNCSGFLGMVEGALLLLLTLQLHFGSLFVEYHSQDYVLGSPLMIITYNINYVHCSFAIHGD